MDKSASGTAMVSGATTASMRNVGAVGALSRSASLPYTPPETQKKAKMTRFGNEIFVRIVTANLPTGTFAPLPSL